MTSAQFKRAIRDYYKKYGRDLPWRKTRNEYAILISEVMLQQTQVARVEGYYKKFLAAFPDFQSLAKAKKEKVLRMWAGLGYNRRALMLHELAKIVVHDFSGKLPRDRAVLEQLPGIGKGTSGSLFAFAFNRPEIFIETNIRRVFIHFFFPKKKSVTDREIVRYIERTLDLENPREWYWALMDYGAMLGKSGAVGANPNHRSAHYKKQSPFGGSDRELRGKLLRLALLRGKIPLRSLYSALNAPMERIRRVTDALCKEGFLGINGKYICIK